MLKRPGMVTIAAVGDIHCTRKSQGTLRPLFAQMAARADIVLLCGDLTDYGLPEEGRILVEELKAVDGCPVVAVLGNHDFESGKEAEIQHLLETAGVTLLDGDTCEIYGIGFAGVKGFAGGFDGRSLEAWGEPVIKQFVHEAVDEALKLETALSRLDVEHRVVLLHYSPIRATLEGEPHEIFPFLGSRRLEDPLNRFKATLVLHGHAHHGSPEGTTRAGIPVYNVALPLLKQHYPDRFPFKLFDLTILPTQAAL